MLRIKSRHDLAGTDVLLYHLINLSPVSNRMKTSSRKVHWGVCLVL